MRLPRRQGTVKASLEVSEYYDIQELTDSYAEQANPVAMMQRVRLGEINPWNGEDTIDATQLPQELYQVPEYIGNQVEKLTRARATQIERYIAERRITHEREKLRKEIKEPEPAGNKQ